MNTVTFAICTHNNHDTCLNLLHDLSNQINKNFNVIIQDNSSISCKSNSFHDFLKKSEFKYIKQYFYGLSESRNFCALNCDTEFIYFLDDDVRIDSNFASEVIQITKENKDITAFGGKSICFDDNDNILSNSPLILSMVSYFNLGDNTFELTKPSDRLIGCNFGVKVKKLNEYGMFKPFLGRISFSNNLLSGEETELIRAFIENKETVKYTPSLSVKHIINPSKLTEEWLIKRLGWQAVTECLSDSKKVPSHKDWAAFYANCESLSSTYDQDLYLEKIYSIVHHLLS